MKKQLIWTALAMAFVANSSAAKAQEIDFVSVEIRTGGDDLRGGDDNAFVSIWSYREDGRQRGITRQLNRENRRIPDYTTRLVSFEMPDGTDVSDITAFHLFVRGFGGGVDGDNWNVDSIRVTAKKDGITVAEFINEYASPLLRFTGEFQFFGRDLRVR